MISDAQQIINSAKSFLGKGIVYQMGADSLSKMDCSAFIWRVLGDRKFDGKVWRNTDWLCSPKALDLFETAEASDGCVVAYPGKNGKRGHTAIVVDVENKIIIDCASSTKGVTQRNGSFFWRNPRTIFLKVKNDD